MLKSSASEKRWLPWKRTEAMIGFSLTLTKTMPPDWVTLTVLNRPVL